MFLGISAKLVFLHFFWILIISVAFWVPPLLHNLRVVISIQTIHSTWMCIKEGSSVHHDQLEPNQIRPLPDKLEVSSVLFFCHFIPYLEQTCAIAFE